MISTIISVALLASFAQGYAHMPRSYTTYENKQCVGTGTDILRDFQGTVAECEAKCDELDCIGFVRVHSGAPQHTGRCYFRGGDMERPYDYTSDDRDCYIPGQYGVDAVDDAMSFIFLSDVEYAYRNNYGDKVKHLIEWIADIGSQGYTFDDEYASYSVDSDLVIHGGDISDLDYGTWSALGTTGSSKGDDASDHLYSDHWQQLYDAGIPMISALGNHHFDLTKPSTSEPNTFVSQSYAKSKDLMGDDFEYKEFKNTHDKNGPSLFVSDFEGVQIVNLNYLVNSLEYSDQYNALSDALDDSKTTMFFGHFPLPGRTITRVTSLMNRFDGKAKYFCGHNHVRSGPC